VLWTCNPRIASSFLPFIKILRMHTPRVWPLKLWTFAWDRWPIGICYMFSSITSLYCNALSLSYNHCLDENLSTRSRMQERTNTFKPRDRGVTICVHVPVCLCVCTYICTCVCACTHTHTHTHIYIYLCMSMCAFVCVCMYVYVSMYVCRPVSSGGRVKYGSGVYEFG